jgi:glycerophosphoryl diester phosphodiesterase
MNHWLEPRRSQTPLIVGHRGACAHAPENTLAAFRQAREQGADGIELDAKRCASGEVVVMHDPTLNRTTNGDGAISEWSLAELRTLNAGQGERVPTLDEVFESIGPDLLVNVEVTNYTTRNDGLEAAVINVVRRHKIEARILFSSFNPLSVRTLATLAPDIPRAILYSANMPIYLRDVWLSPFVAHQFRHPEYHMVTPEYVQYLRTHGRLVNTWTVNDAAEIRRMAACQVHGIIGDSPQTMREVLAARGRRLEN